MSTEKSLDGSAEQAEGALGVTASSDLLTGQANSEAEVQVQHTTRHAILPQSPAS